MVETKFGKIEGVDKGNYMFYGGIPYAQPPVGQLRWKDPVPAEPWDGVYMADHFKSRSMQGKGTGGFYEKEFRDDPFYVTEPSEDSLYLNIWTPKNYKNKKFPVAFWIHGGAFMGGCGHEKEFDGAAYCSRDVILVTINYRLGIWGFLAHPWFRAENEHQVSGNYGLKDQIMALKWVYENIAAFGGDPENITVFGQSAGAMSTQTLVSSPLTGNMIAKAIMQSGGGYGGLSRDDLTLDIQESYGEEFAELAGAKNAGQLRALSAAQVMKVMETWMASVMKRSKGLFLAPTIDQYVLTDGYKALIAQGKIKDIPYLLGSNKDDIFVSEESKSGKEYSEIYKSCVAFSHWQEKIQGKPAYVYFFKRNLPGDEAGAFHSAELWYTFGTLARSWRPFEEHDYYLSEMMLDYWTNFMKYGTPDQSNAMAWPACSQKDCFVKIFE